MITERQPDNVVGRTHASSVTLVTSSAAASLTVTQSLVPLKVSAEPECPAVVLVAPEITPVRLLPDESSTLVPLVSLKPYAATSPGAPSSFTIVPVACASAMVALRGLLSVTVNVSFGSIVVSPLTVTVIVAVVVPGRNRNRPQFAA